MSASTANARFMTTNWTLIARARNNRAALDELLQQYWNPIYAYLRRAGYRREDAAELTQEFIADVMLERDLIGRASPQTGQFRAFLKMALRNFIIDHRRSRAGRHSAANFPQLDQAALENAEPESHADPSIAYDRQWARTVMTIALERVRADCVRQGLDAHWNAFEHRVLTPEMRGDSRPPLEDVARQLALESADVAAGMIFTVKRKLRTAVQSVVSETVSTPSELESELAALKHALSR